MAEMPRKFPKPHTNPVLAQIDCDSLREEEINVRFTIAISALQIIKVTELTYSHDHNNENQSSGLWVGIKSKMDASK